MEECSWRDINCDAGGLDGSADRGGVLLLPGSLLKNDRAVQSDSRPQRRA